VLGDRCPTFSLNSFSVLVLKLLLRRYTTRNSMRLSGFVVPVSTMLSWCWCPWDRRLHKDYDLAYIQLKISLRINVENIFESSQNKNIRYMCKIQHDHTQETLRGYRQWSLPQIYSIVPHRFKTCLFYEIMESNSRHFFYYYYLVFVC
jgi:hypothetical protein